jgi:outer membrane lipoprotein-sorting protein
MTGLSVVSCLLSVGLLTGLCQHRGGRFEQDVLSKLPPVALKAIREQDSLRYSGTRIVAFRREGELEKHREFVIKDGRRIRIVFPEGSKFSGQVIVETAHERRHFFPSRNEIHISRPRQYELFEHLFHGGWRGDARTLKFTDEKGSRIAGIRTELVTVKDGSGNVLQTVNIDPESGLVLKRCLYDQSGVQAGSSEFTEVNFHPDLDDSLFVLEHRGARITTPLDDLAKVALKNGFLPAYLTHDSGFDLDSCRTMEIAGQQVLACQYASSQGHMMLFQLARGVDPEKLKRHAPPQLHTKVLQLQGRTFALVGPLDDEILAEASTHLRVGTKR